MGTEQLEYVYVADITKADETPEGLMVYGMAAGPNKDLVGHRASAKWLAKAMPEWYEWANVREQHTAVAAGVGRELTKADGDQWMLKALVVDDNTIRKVKAGVLKGFSIGIKNAKLLGDEIVDGIIPEISLVDRPCNPLATMALCKAAGVDGQWEAIPAAEAENLFADAEGLELTVVHDPSLWMATDAIQKMLSGELTKGAAQAQDISDAHELIKGVFRLIIAEAQEAIDNNDPDEAHDISLLVNAINLLCHFAECEEDEDDPDDDDDTYDGHADDMASYVDIANKVLFSDLNKRDFSQDERDKAADEGDALPDGSYPIKSQQDAENAWKLRNNGKHSEATVVAHIRAMVKKHGPTMPSSGDSDSDSADMNKSVSMNMQTEIDNAVAKVRTAFEADIAGLRAELTKALDAARPGGPVLITQPRVQQLASNPLESFASRPGLSPDVARIVRQAAAEREALPA